MPCHFADQRYVEPLCEEDGRPQHCVEHLRCELSGQRILLTYVVAAEQRVYRTWRSGGRIYGLAARWSSPRHGEIDERRVGEPGARPRQGTSGPLDVIEVRSPRDRAERENYAHARQKRNLVVQEVRAAGDLAGCRLVVGGRAADGRDDVRVTELEPVVPRRARRLVGEPGTVHCGEEEVAGTVAGEHATGAVRAVCSGREPHDEDTRVRVAEAGDWAAPVVRVAEAGDFLARDVLAPRDEAGAGDTADDVSVQEGERTYPCAPYLV